MIKGINTKRVYALFAVFMMSNSLFLLKTQAQLIDKKASTETKNLYKNLKELLTEGVMFGHQDALAYGVEWKYVDGKSDIKDVVGDYPAVYGWDIGRIELGKDKNLDGVPFAKMKQYIRETYDRGGVNTISWHMDNPFTGGDSWDKISDVKSILPGGGKHILYKQWLDRASDFLKDLKDSDGKFIPIIFRPYHELSGSWFWWGKPNTSREDYISLWKFTVDYFRDKKKIHHLIYQFNPNGFTSSEQFLERYPGDDYVDMVSFDTYQVSDIKASEEVIKETSEKFRVELKRGLAILDSVAKKHNKIPAIGETGYEAIPDKTWWTETLWAAINGNKISYVLMWRNHGWQEKEKKFHYYAPYKGQKSAEDFKKFYDLPATLFGEDVAKKQLYK